MKRYYSKISILNGLYIPFLCGIPAANDIGKMLALNKFLKYLSIIIILIFGNYHRLYYIKPQIFPDMNAYGLGMHTYGLHVPLLLIVGDAFLI